MIMDLGGFLGLLTGYQGAAVVVAAWRLGVLQRLSVGSATTEGLAQELGADPRSIEALLDSLVSLGLAAAGPQGYEASGFTANSLGPNAELGLVIEKEAYFARAWQDLEEVIRTGRPALAPWRDRLRSDPEQARSFLEALDVLARLTGPSLGSLPSLAPGKSVIDVGGGLGSYSKVLSEAGSDVTLVELPQVAAWAREALAGTGVTVVEADLITAGIPEHLHGADAALVSHLLHDLEPDACVVALEAVRRALSPAGTVVVNDFAADAGPGPFGPLFDLMMRVETGGSAYSIAELTDFLNEAGFAGVTRADLPPPLTVLEARAQ